MIKIKFFCDWEDDKSVYHRINNLYFKNYKSDKLQIVYDDSYTHAIIFNAVMPKLNIPKENVIGFAQEPLKFLKLTDSFIKYAKDNISEYYLGNDISTFPFISGYSFLFHNIKEQDIIEKKGKIAIWCSNKKDAPGHKYRHALVRKILEKKLEIDIWGNGCHLYSGENVKGGFENEPYKNYEYCISIENYETDDYISEKLLNCLVYNTIPVYLGAKNIDKYFGDCCIKLTGNLESDINILKNIIQNSPKKDLGFARKQLFEGDCYLPNFLEKKWIN